MSKNTINIKGTIFGLVICIEPDFDFTTIKHELEAKIKAQTNFFKNAKFKIYIPNDQDNPIIKELEDLCVTYDMIPDQNIPWPQSNKSNQPYNKGVNSTKNYALNEINSAKREAAATLTENKGNSSSSSSQETLLIDRNLRSGQKLYYPGNVVILGDVNPGAEICADGDIIVMGNLRGIAHAGANGNEKVIIIAYRLQPTQLRIADKVTRSPDKEEAEDTNQPELARLNNNQVIIEPYIPQKVNWGIIG